jgi:hypothetical protein
VFRTASGQWVRVESFDETESGLIRVFAALAEPPVALAA